MERQKAGPGKLDETISIPREGVGRPTIEAGLNQTEGWRSKLEASGVPELAPVADGLARLEALAGLLEHEGRRLAGAER